MAHQVVVPLPGHQPPPSTATEPGPWGWSHSLPRCLGLSDGEDTGVSPADAPNHLLSADVTSTRLPSLGRPFLQHKLPAAAASLGGVSPACPPRVPALAHVTRPQVVLPQKGRACPSHAPCPRQAPRRPAPASLLPAGCWVLSFTCRTARVKTYNWVSLGARAG